MSRQPRNEGQHQWLVRSGELPQLETSYTHRIIRNR